MNGSILRKSQVAIRALAAALGLCGAVPGALADTPQPRVVLGRWAGPIEVGPRMKAGKANLRGSEFVGQDLRGAILDGADLYNVHFWDCNLSGASFKGADLTNGFLQACPQIEGADFTDAVILGLVADHALSPRQLRSTQSYKARDLRRCFAISAFDPTEPASMPAYDFRNANLEGARLSHGDFRNSDFTNARIEGMELAYCRIPFSLLASTGTFRSREALRMRFLAVAFEGTPDFTGFRLAGTHFVAITPDATFTGADVAECRFAGTIDKVQLRRTQNFAEGKLTRTAFDQVDLSGFDFARLNLTGCDFSRCDLTNASFADAVITNVRFVHQTNRGLTVEQIKSTWNYKNGRMQGVVLPKEVAEALRKE